MTRGITSSCHCVIGSPCHCVIGRGYQKVLSSLHESLSMDTEPIIAVLFKLIYCSIP